MMNISFPIFKTITKPLELQTNWELNFEGILLLILYK
jgi:hypothetical protein